MRLMRDATIDTLCAAARKDRDLLFISADFGAAALDALRRDLPEQFLHVGICEQNMVDLASGLALSGKRVFLYAMAPFITARCYEQTKCALAAMNLPATLIAVGVGLGYDHATLTHFTPEDLAIMRALNGIEIWTPADDLVAEALAQLCVAKPAFRYIRLERSPQPRVYDDPAAVIASGVGVLRKGGGTAIVACGALLANALEAADGLAAEGIATTVIDLARIKPQPTAALVEALAGCDRIVTVEEHMREAGLGSAVLEMLADADAMRPTRRLGLNDGFEVKNGHRADLHRAYGLDAAAIAAAVREGRG